MESELVQNLRPKNPYRKPDVGDEVVITGMAGKFPNSNNIYNLRDNLFNKVDVVAGAARRWKYMPPEVSEMAGRLFDIEKFDAGCFGVTSTQSNTMDPMLRMLLERTYEAIADAGCNPSDIEGTRTAIIFGFTVSETENHVLYRDLTSQAEAIIGTQRSTIAQRLSYYLKVKGPAYSLDTACGSSLYAIDQAFISIREGLCDKAIVCAANLCLNPMLLLQFKRTGILSSLGSCKSFDENCDGYVRSEAVVAMVLEKARDARRIYSEIVYAKSNCGGFNQEGITFPSSEGQKILLKDFYGECGIDPKVLTYMEAHGTGTRAGDFQELPVIDNVFCKGRDNPLHIGSIKSNIGHTEPVSGLCSIIKVLLSMETNFIPPNIHYKTPRVGVKSLEDGRMLVVTEKMPLPDQRGLFGVSNFGFGGANSHVLLRWNSKSKTYSEQPHDGLPRLICLSSRVESGIHSILDDYGTRRCDAEFAYLIHQAFRKSLPNHLYRGYGIYNKHGEIKRSLKDVKLKKQKLCLVFNNFDEEWLKLANRLMDIPIFAGNMKSIQTLILELLDVDISHLMKSKPDVSLVIQILCSAAIQISLVEVLKELKLAPDHVVGLGSSELVAAYVDGYLTLKQTILTLFYIACASWDKTNNNITEILEKILPSRKKIYEKWIPMREEMLNNGCAKSFANNIRINLSESDLQKIIPSDAYTLVIGPCLNNFEIKAINLMHLDSEDYVVNFFNALGSLYINGFDMELDKLYPPVELPVSRGTPMLSPLIKWNHSDWNVHIAGNEAHVNKGHRVIRIELSHEDWNFILGYVIDGNNWFPATGYLFLVWESFALITGKLLPEMKVVFEDVKYIRAVKIPKDGSIEFAVMIQTGTQTFEVTEGGDAIVTGRIYEETNEHTSLAIPSTTLQDSQNVMIEEDVYKELKLRGYEYTGNFKSVKKCSFDATWGIVEWKNSWISFIDCLVQLSTLKLDTRSLLVPSSISQVVIDAPKHLHLVKDMENMVPIYLYKHLKVIKAGGVEINGLDFSVSSTSIGDKPVLEISKFIPNNTRLEFQNSIRSLVQVVLENSNTTIAKVIEISAKEQNESHLICVTIQASLNDTPVIQQDVTLVTSKPIHLPGISIRENPLSAETRCLILIVNNLLETTDVSMAINVIKDVKGFVITRESLDVDLSKFSKSPFMVICCHTLKKETLVLLRPLLKAEHGTEFLDLSKAVDNLDDWIPKLQHLLKGKSNVVLFAQDGEVSGILGLVKCLKWESYGSRISCVLIMDKAPEFDPKLPFYKNQLEKNMAINVWKDGSWGTYRHLPKPLTNLVENEHCYVNVTSRGDLSTLTWLEGNLSPKDLTCFSEDNIYIYYSALSFRDLMTASGKISPNAITTNRMEQDCVQDFEFAGRNSKGQRVMGIGTSGAIGTFIKSKYIFPIPDHWTMEDAATVMVTYGTVLDALFSNFDVKSGQSILIHSGTGGIGLSAINLCLYFGLTIFVTDGTQEKRDYLKKHYPQIEIRHIGNSSDTSFEHMIHKYTKGRGVDYILNSLPEEKLLASIRCLAEGGKFLEVGKFDLSSNNALALRLLERRAQFVGMTLDTSLKHNYLKKFRKLEDLIEKGAIKPLPRTVFEINDVEKAFRYMEIGDYIGKVLIKNRKEESENIHSVPRKLFKGVPRFYCKSECSYIIYGGLGGIGLELADFMVMRGARKLLLTSRTGICNGYQRYRISKWESYGVTVVTTTHDASKEESCTELLNIANKLGPVDGIFNLAVVLKDSLFENHTVENFKAALPSKVDCTKNLDHISRKLCPSIRYFVVFSSLVGSRGNIGQTNYGMANSAMERICEKRRKEGYPALVIQWGAIGEVGCLAKIQESGREFSTGGSLQQTVSSCLQVLDQFLRQDETIVSSMMVAEKKSSKKSNNLFDEIVDIMGIINVKSVSMHATFPELGLDSISAVNIKQILEEKYKLFLIAEDLKSMTLAKLNEISNAQESSPNLNIPVSQNIPPIHKQSALEYMENEEFLNVGVINIKTMLKGENMNEFPHIILLPGIEGVTPILESLGAKLKADVSCIQNCFDNKAESITQLAQSLLPHIETCLNGDSVILAYSFGTIVAIEILAMLESKGKNAKAIFIDGSPDLMTYMVHTCFPTNDENLFQTSLLSAIMMKYIPHEEISKHQKTLMKTSTYKEKVDYVTSVVSKIDVSDKYIADMCTSYYERLKRLSIYRVIESKLRSKVTLLKAKHAPFLHLTADYGLSKICQDNVEVFTMEGNHVTILESNDLAMRINEILER